MYKIKRVLNNNTVYALDSKGTEVILKGRGIGFERSANEVVTNDNVEKIFTLKDKKNSSQFFQLVSSIPYQYIQAAEHIIAYANQSLNKKLDEHIYVTLSDHIAYVMERQREGLMIKNPLLWEIKRFYQPEFIIGQEAVCLIKDELGVQLNDDEAGFISLHIVNAEMNIDMEQSVRMTETMQDILDIIKYYFRVVFDESQFSYARMTTHLKFFVQRAISGEQYVEQDSEFSDFIRRKYPKAYDCTNQIAEYMKKKWNYDMSEEEKLYLTVHIYHVVHELEGSAGKDEKIS